jgi:signal transduction histidine kinase
VRSIAPLDPGKSLIRLAMGSRVMEARVEKPPQPDHLIVDHRVRITGLAAGFVNEWRQLVQPYLRVREWNEVEVLAPAPPAAEVPLVSAEDLLAFRVTGHGEQRVRIEGDVTATFAPTQIFVRNGERGFAVRLVAPTPLQPGDHVTLAGFPEMGRFSASIVDAELVQRTAGPAPVPLEIESPDKLAGTHDGNLLRVGGVVREVFKSEGATTVQLAGKTQSVQVRIPEEVEPPAVGARVRLTGICQVESAAQTSSGYTSRPGIVSLRARSAGDIVTVQSPSWWTSRRLASALGVLLAVVFLAALWITGLRSQVRRQTQALRVRIEAEAALEERQRIAREFHDTLEQELAGVTLRLDALATRSLDDKGRSLITASRNLVSRIQSETRDLINDLRDPTEAAGDLVTALAGVAARHSADSGVQVWLDCAETIPPLRPAFVHDLRMIARESVTNAIKHGRATDVRLRVERSDAALLLQIVDNGCGFDPAIIDRQKRGHFGCEGIRERARKIGAEVAWRSVPPSGTSVEVILPLGPARAVREAKEAASDAQSAMPPLSSSSPSAAKTALPVDSSAQAE